MSGLPEDFYGVVFTGLFGAGKTTLSKIIGDRLGWHAPDADGFVKCVGGFEFAEGHKLMAEEVVVGTRIFKYRREILELILTTKFERPIILATTLRPVLLEGPREDVVKALEKNWLVLHLDRDVDQISRYFIEHPDMKSLRPPLKDCETFRQVRDRLHDLRRQMAGLYADLASGYVLLNGLPGDFEDAFKVSTEVLRFCADVVRRVKGKGIEVCG